MVVVNEPGLMGHLDTDLVVVDGPSGADPVLSGLFFTSVTE